MRCCSLVRAEPRRRTLLLLRLLWIEINGASSPHLQHQPPRSGKASLDSWVHTAPDTTRWKHTFTSTGSAQDAPSNLTPLTFQKKMTPIYHF